MPSSVSPMKRAALVAVLLAGLAGCDTAAMLSRDPGPYDGIWAGRILFTYGTASCPRRGVVKAEIRNGILNAELRWPDGTGDMDGTVNDDGTLHGSDLSRKGFDFGEAKGMFEERTAKGTFSGRKCRGSWELQKVRSL